MQVAPKSHHEVAPSSAPSSKSRSAPAEIAELSANQFPQLVPEVVRLAVHHFRVPGSSLRFSLRKRKAGRFEPWYLVSVVRGRRFHHSLETPDIKVAEEKARLKYILPALKEDWQKVDDNKIKRHWTTVGELLAHWVTLNLGAGEQHVRQVANQFQNVLRQAGVSDPEQASCAVLTGATAFSYFNAVQREADAGAGQIEAARRKRTGISTWNQAKSLLQPAALVEYEDAGLMLPDVEEFLGRGAMRVKRMKKESKLPEAPPDLELMAKLLAEWPALPWNEFAAVGMALAFGLRAGEWGKARWEWFTVLDGRWVLDAKTDVKNKSGVIKVSALDPFFATFRARALREGAWLAEGYVIAGTDGERENQAEERVSAWMRAKGWTGQKTNHSFRAYAGALVVLRWDHSEARHWLRHASVTTTEKHYTDRWRDENRARAVKVEWAGVEKVES